jgi:hypothetical protein
VAVSDRPDTPINRVTRIPLLWMPLSSTSMGVKCGGRCAGCDAGRGEDTGVVLWSFVGGSRLGVMGGLGSDWVLVAGSALCAR